MTLEDLEILTRDKIKAIIEASLTQDPAQFALAQSDNAVPTALVSTQLKYLQKSRVKLPSFFKARCILPPRAYEQSSSEIASSAKNYKGTTCLDLTCGLGVDTFHFSQHFSQVTSLEPNPVLAAVTQHNLRLLGVSHVTIVNESAESFLQDYEGPDFDLVYADPDRRDPDGKRVSAIDQCTPNVIALLSRISAISRQILFKFSPLLDVTEAQRIFPYADQLSIVSVSNECKELLITLPGKHNSIPSPLNWVIWLHSNSYHGQYVFDGETVGAVEVGNHPDPSYLLEPDVAFYKARKIADLFAVYFPQLSGLLTHLQGYFCTTELLSSFPGRRFRVEASFPYQPKRIRQWCKQTGIKKIHISRRQFPISIREIRKQINIKEGGTHFLICTTIEGKKVAFICVKII